MEQSVLIKILDSCAAKPLSTHFHCDDRGDFKGMAFIKFRTPEDAARVFAQLACIEIEGRKLRVEYKKLSEHRGRERSHSSASALAHPVVCRTECDLAFLLRAVALSTAQAFARAPDPRRALRVCCPMWRARACGTVSPRARRGAVSLHRVIEHAAVLSLVLPRPAIYPELLGRPSGIAPGQNHGWTIFVLFYRCLRQRVRWSTMGERRVAAHRSDAEGRVQGAARRGSLAVRQAGCVLFQWPPA